MSEVINIGTQRGYSLHLRQEWAESLDEHMAMRGMSRKQLVAQLGAVGCDVSVQAVGQWLRGVTAPRPDHQAALAAVLQTPVRRLFPIEPMAVAS